MKPTAYLTLLENDKPRKYGCLMAYLSEQDGAPFLAMGREIPDKDLYAKEGFGREDTPHCTVAYGFDDDPDFAILRNYGPVHLKFGKVSLFKNDDEGFHVVKVDVISEELDELHDLVKAEYGTPGDSHPVYHPHLTIAYCLPGQADRYVGDDRFKGVEVSCRSLVYSSKASEKSRIAL